MQESDIVTVDHKMETICCDGGKDGLGHPAVYFIFDNSNTIVCNYCGKTYVKERES